MPANASISLSSVDTFGDVAAETDPVLEYFLNTNAVDDISTGRTLLVLGRKGTGKTAIVRYFTEQLETLHSRAVSLRGYPWNVHATRIDHGTSEIEAYVSSWRYLISVELSILILSSQRAAGTRKGKLISQFLRDNYGGIEPNLSDILRPERLKLTSLSLKPSVMGNELGGVDLARKPGDHSFGVELNALTNSIMDAVREAAQEADLPPLSLHFDELDQGLSQFDAKRKNMLIGLILAAREFKRESERVASNVRVVVYLRTDLWDELQFSDKNKTTQSQALQLIWNSDSLLALVNNRLRAKLSNSASWNDIAAADLMRGSQTKWNHILNRTFLRPRDVIQFLNVALREAKKRNANAVKFNNPDIVSAREEYSSYLKAELDDEIIPHWPAWDSALKACSGVATLTFDRTDFEAEYARRINKKITLVPMKHSR